MLFVRPYAKSKMAASLFIFQFFYEVLTDNFQIYDELV